MSRWYPLPLDPGAPRVWEGDEYRVRDARGRVHDVTLRSGHGGGRGLYDADGEPVDAVEIEL